MNISDLINSIKTAKFGRDVLNSIADALEQAYKDADANVSMEVAAARANYETLGARLEQMESDSRELGKKAENLENRIIITTSLPSNLEDGQVCIVYGVEK